VISINVLDAGPLSLVTNPRGGEEAASCKEWLERMLASGARVVVPGIADYEVRRELLRAGKTAGLSRLDLLIETLGYVPIDQEVLRTAARLWSEARRRGKPTSPDLALDADCILAAQARTAFKLLSHEQLIRGFAVRIVTKNRRHLDQFGPAEHWDKIPPDDP